MVAAEHKTSGILTTFLTTFQPAVGRGSPFAVPHQHGRNVLARSQHMLPLNTWKEESIIHCVLSVVKDYPSPGSKSGPPASWSPERAELDDYYSSKDSSQAVVHVETSCMAAQMNYTLPQNCCVGQSILLPDAKIIMSELSCSNTFQFGEDAIGAPACEEAHANCDPASFRLDSRIAETWAAWIPQAYTQNCGEQCSMDKQIVPNSNIQLFKGTTTNMKGCHVRGRVLKVWLDSRNALNIKTIYCLIMMQLTMVDAQADVRGLELVTVAIDSAIVISIVMTTALMATDALGLGVAKRENKLQRFSVYVTVVLAAVGLIAFVCLPYFHQQTIISTMAVDIIHAGPDGCNLYRGDMESSWHRTWIEIYVKLGLAVLFLFILLCASVSIDNHPKSVNGVKFFFWALILLIVLSEALVLISQVKVFYRGSSVILILVLAMMLIERGVIDCDDRLTSTCFITGSIADRGITSLTYMLLGVVMTWTMYDTGRVSCEGYNTVDLFDENLCSNIVSQCHMHVDHDHRFLRKKMAIWAPMVLWAILRMLWTIWGQLSSQHRIQRSNSAIHLVGLAAIFVETVGVSQPRPSDVTAPDGGGTEATGTDGGGTEGSNSNRECIVRINDSS